MSRERQMGNSHSTVRQLLWTHGVAAHSFMFLEDSGKFILEFLYTYEHVCERALCTLIQTHRYTQTHAGWCGYAPAQCVSLVKAAVQD